MRAASPHMIGPAMKRPDSRAQPMDEKLRRWLESRCRTRPDGTCLAEVPVIQAAPAPVFVLPDEAAKDTYLACALRLGRFRLASEFALTLLLYALGIWFSLSVVLKFEGGVVPWAAATLSVLLLAALRQAGVMRGAGQLRAWLDRTGKEAPQDSERIEEEREAHWLWQAGLKRCRPGWMVTAEALGYCAFATSFVLFSLASRPHCRRTLWARWRAEAPPAPWHGDCFGAAVMLSVIAWGAVLKALAIRDWWRSSRSAS